MQSYRIALVACCFPLAQATSPVGKVLSMISDLQAKITKEGGVAQKEYADYAEWCEDRSRNLGFEIKTGNSEVESLKAAIAVEVATTQELNAKVDELTGAISVDESDLTAAGFIRKKEAAVFAAEEKELTATIDMLARATAILERQMNGGASMMQIKNAGSLVEALSVMVQASLIGTADATRLSAFLQASQSGQDADDEQAPGAPAGAVYQSQSGGIVDTLQDLSDKAESQLADARKKEVADRHSYEMMKQALVDEIKVGNKDLADAQSGLSESAEKKAVADGDLGVTAKELANDVKQKETLIHDCEAKAASFAAETKSREEELKALAEAKGIIEEATSAAALNQVSFVQIARSANTHRYEAVRLVRDLAHQQGSSALAQLASRMTSAMQTGDGFEKVKTLISEMISKLEDQAGEDATKKAFCDKELAETGAKKADKTDESEKLSVKIEQLSAKSAQLKEEVAALESELSKLAKAQAAMDKLRLDEKAAFEENSAELQKGITGIKAALQVLREYYDAPDKAHDAADGAASGIIGLLEVVEADFSKNLAQITADEEAGAREYEDISKANEIDRTAKEQDVKYKAKESTRLDKTSAELASDRKGVQAELDAVQEYLTKIEDQCIAKAETYAVREERRAAEIAGLKEALQILESETALVQQRVARRTLRGASLSPVAP